MCFLPRAIKLIYGDEDTDTEIGREGLRSARLSSAAAGISFIAAP